MSGHTKGPWERLEGVVEAGHPIYKEGAVVVRIVQKRAPDQTDFVKVALVDTGAANARLIAAAPDHHAVALELYRLMLVIESAVRFADPSYKDEVQAMLRANKAALNKARATEAQP